jgi:hypothetical protein
MKELKILDNRPKLKEDRTATPATSEAAEVKA